MSLKALIADGIDIAFNLLDDLKSVGLLTRTGEPSFDFETSTQIDGATTRKTVRFVELDAGNKKVSISKKQLLIDTTELRHFSEIEIKGVSWKLGEVIQEGRFVSLVDVYK